MNNEVVELKYLGRTEEVVIQRTAFAAVMDSAPEYRRNMRSVKRVTHDPETNVTTYYGATGKCEKVGPGVRTFKAGKPAIVLLSYDPDKDPERFIISWRLHNAALLKDQEIEGAKLSDWCFFDAQIKAIHKSTLWGLRNKLKLPYRTAMKYANQGTAIYKREVLLTRGVDLDQPIKPEDAANDADVMRHQAMKEFHASHTKYW